MSCIINKYAATRFEARRRASRCQREPQLGGIWVCCRCRDAFTSSEPGSLSSPVRNFSYDACAQAHIPYTHVCVCVCISCSRLISIFRLPHSLVKGPQRLPASPFSLLLSLAHLFLVRIRSLTRALRRLIKIVMERETGGRGRGAEGLGEISLLILAHFNLHSVSSSSSFCSALCLVFWVSQESLTRQMECVLSWHSFCLVLMLSLAVKVP